LSGDSAHTDVSGHGTIMAALIAGTGADNGVQGLAPGVDILPIRTHETEASGFDVEGTFADAVQYAVDEGADIISVSNGIQPTGYAQDEVTAALEEAARQDVLVFAATGNDAENSNMEMFPSNQDGVVGVGAVD
ncbi:S8 family serine peptidase, partial [Streptomyces sp. 7-21]|uniref:S8 family serine peptidase n=1 Tax=Streptomyces sp. 7-21 TaxID=2802283 RepID=UPI00191F7487